MKPGKYVTRNSISFNTEPRINEFDVSYVNNTITNVIRYMYDNSFDLFYSSNDTSYALVKINKNIKIIRASDGI